MPRCQDLAIFVLTTDDRHTNGMLYPLLRMRARGVIILWIRNEYWQGSMESSGHAQACRRLSKQLVH